MTQPEKPQPRKIRPLKTLTDVKREHLAQTHRPRLRIVELNAPKVGGEDAARLYSIVRSFPLSVDYGGGIKIENTATGEDLDVFTRAFEAVELAVMVDEANCSDRASHATLSADDFHRIVLEELMYRVRCALGIGDVPDPIWE